MKLYPRSLKNSIIEGAKLSPVIVINGARQTGKSTIAKELINEGVFSNYLTLDDPNVIANILNDPENYLKNLPAGTVIDEIQKLPSIFGILKKIVDDNRTPGRFIITGSANILLLPKISESLAGRTDINTIMPLSQVEIVESKINFVDFVYNSQFKFEVLKNNFDYYELIVRGFFPEVVLRNTYEERERWFASYINTLLIRDIKDISNIEQSSMLPQVLRMLASQVGGMFNASDVARNVGLSNTTFARYMTILETLFLIEKVPAWFSNIGKRLTKSPKIYFNDTGIVSYLLGADQNSIANDSKLKGSLIENLAYLELKKQSSWSTTKPNIFYLRSSDGAIEVDFILEARNGNKIGIEVKAKDSLKPSDFGHLVTLINTYDQIEQCIILYTGNTIQLLSNKIWAVPIQYMWNK
jgi:uncharacterized protein